MADIPLKDRPEWVEMAQGRHPMKKFVLQLQIDKVRKQMESGDMTMDDAVTYLHDYFTKYPKGFRTDLLEIFKSW